MVNAVTNFDIASSSSFRDIQKNHFVTAAEADIDDIIKRKRILRVSLNNTAQHNNINRIYVYQKHVAITFR